MEKNQGYSFYHEIAHAHDIAQIVDEDNVVSDPVITVPCRFIYS